MGYDVATFEIEGRVPVCSKKCVVLEPQRLRTELHEALLLLGATWSLGFPICFLLGIAAAAVAVAVAAVVATTTAAATIASLPVCFQDFARASFGCRCICSPSSHAPLFLFFAFTAACVTSTMCELGTTQLQVIQAATAAAAAAAAAVAGRAGAAAAVAAVARKEACGGKTANP
ncbi:hypothetical protein Emed_005524 [Eimeria media]